MSAIFRPRVKQLLALEGWYDVLKPTFPPDVPYRFKISCRFNDILRCAEFSPGKPHHFTSCFNRFGQHREQPIRYCQDPSWAIAYVPDKHGNFLGRAFVHWLAEGHLEVGRVYGNRLSVEDILTIKIMHDNVRNVGRALSDTYLPEIAR